MADVQFDFGSDFSSFFKGMKEAREELRLFRDEAEKARANLGSAFQGAASGANSFENELRQSLKAQSEQKTMIDELIKKLRALEQAQTSAYDGDEIKQLIAKIKQLEDELGRLRTAQQQAGQAGQQAASGTKSMFSEILKGTLVANIIQNITSKLAELPGQILSITQKFEKYNSILRNTFQNSGEAAESLQLIKDLAAATPFAVDELTESYIKLVNRGFKPTGEEIVKLGDLAASQGKSFDQLVEATLDAQTGEFERLKEFGIKTKTVGDNVILTFKGIEKQVKKTDEEGIRNAILSFGELQGVVGGMAAVSATLEGKLSNLGDGFDSLLNAIGERGSDLFKGFIDGVAEGISLLKDFIAIPVEDKLQSEQAEINNSILALTDENTSRETKNQIIAELNQKYPELFKNLDLESASNEKLLGFLDGVNKAYKNKIELAALSDISKKATDDAVDAQKDEIAAVKELNKELTKLGFTREQIAAGITRDQLNAAKREVTNTRGDFAGYSTDAAFAQLNALENARKELTKATDKGLNAQSDISATTTRNATDDAKAVERYQNAINKYTAAASEIKKQLKGATVAETLANGLANPKLAANLQEFESYIDKYEGLLTGLTAGKVDPKNTPIVKVTELTDAELKKQKAARDKALKEEEERQKRILALERELAKARIDLLVEGRAKEIAIENNNNSNTIEDLQNKRGAKGVSPKEIQLIDSLIEAENAGHTGRLLAIDMKYYKDAQKALEDANKSISDILTKDQTKEETAVKKKYEAIFKVIEETQKKLQTNINAGIGDPLADEAAYSALTAQKAQLTEKQQKELNAITLKYNLKTVNEAEALAEAQNAILLKSGLSQKDLEELKEKNKLQIVIDYAKRKLELLQATGDAENALQILQLQKLIQDSEKSLNDLGKGKKVKSLSDYIFGEGKALGLFKSEQEFNDIKDGFGVVVGSLTDIFTAGVDARIAAQQKLVDELNKQVDEQESIVDREKDLFEKGYANNYVIEEQKLNDLKRRNEEEKNELKKQAEAKAKNAQTLALIQGTITAIQLAATAAGYFANSTQYGPIAGPILALAAIATMFATFASAKQKGKEVGSFRHGGELDMTSSGRKHEDGGIGLYEGGEKIAEAEGGEYGYIFKDGRKAKMFKPLFDAINKNDFAKFAPRLNAGVLEKVAENSNAARPTMIINTTGGVSEMHGTLKQVEQNTRPQKSVTYHDGYRVEREGSNVRKIVKKTA